MIGLRLYHGREGETDLEHSEDRQYELEAISAIEKWKAEKPGVAALALHYAFTPVAWIFHQIVPAQAISAVLQGADWVAEQTIPTGCEPTTTASLRERDQDAREVQNWAIAYAVGEGAAAGFFGILSAPVDIPATIMLSLRAIRRIGACYGYTANEDSEREFVLGVLGAAGANTVEEKIGALYALTALQRTIVANTFKKMAEAAAANQFSKESAVVLARSLAKQVGVNLTKRRMLAAIPAIGALIGGSMNGWYLKDVGIAAQRVFQERWLRDHGMLVDVEHVSEGV